MGIVMEVRNNLIEQDRVNMLKRFPSDMFRKIAQVQIGDASSDFKQKTQSLMLANKQDIENKKHAHSVVMEKRKKRDEYNKKLAEFKKKKADIEKAKKQKELKKKQEAEKKEAEKKK